MSRLQTHVLGEIRDGGTDGTVSFFSSKCSPFFFLVVSDALGRHITWPTS